MSVGAHELQCRFTLFMPRPVSWRLGAQLTGMVGCLPPAAVGKPLEKRLGDRAVAFSVGFVEHPVITRGWPTAAVRSGYLRAALAGVETYWIPDHLNSLVPRSIAVPKYVGLARLVPDVDVACEPWTLLGQVAGWNRIGRLRLGVAVTDGGRRNPAVTAQAAATLHLMSRGRAILGIGVGEREGNEPYGVDWSRPVARFEEALATIRALWDSGGELVSRDSEFFPLRKALFALPPYRGEYPPIWVAAHGPRMLHITGCFVEAETDEVGERSDVRE